MAYIGNTATTQAFTAAVDYFSGNGSTTAFTLSRPVASVYQVEAVINNVPQDPATAYTVSGSTITFTSAPPTGSNNIYVMYTSPITQIIQPGQGTVGATQIDGNYALWNRSGSTINYTAGNVGIGTSSPSARLHVSTSSSTQAKFNRDGNNALLTIFQSATDSYISATNTGAALILATQDTERARIDSSGNLLFNSGYGSVATAYGCRAWVNFNGTSTVAIRASGNVSSITDNGTGDYTVNFTNAMPDVNYSAAVAAGDATASGKFAFGYWTAAPTTSAFRMGTSAFGGAQQDQPYISAVFFR